MLNATDATQVTFLGEFVSRGRRWNAYSDGTVLPVIAGGNGAGDGAGQGGDGGAGAAGSGGAGAGGSSDDRRFTQADMNATVARETQAAKTKAEQDIASSLGVTVDEAKQIIADRRAADDAKKTEAERNAAAAETAKTEAERIKAEAATDRHHARLERALGRGGLDIENSTLLRAGLAALDVPLDSTDDVVKSSIEQLKKDAPQLFTGGAGGGGTHSDAGGQRNGGGGAPTGEFGGRGAAEAQRRWGSKDSKTA